ncbi:3-phosphoshikimate 1-carboxyvinyltransferase [Nevskia soli]|uniref:3-phosphoshikimate 1-carboxyvinyltransferase n=1 Tax=Nevskia soli TaxID=418856 RepID=UPI0015D787D6|nr:3-phosphoshikimate 1-carboxyvinyltransferase [Nevskia soli]
MQKIIQPAGQLSGSLDLPGDKSISHRYAILASLAEGRSVIRNFATGADCHSTLGCVGALGIPVSVEGATVTIEGRGLDGWTRPGSDLDAGNSGSAMRMLAGPLAAQPFSSCLIGDESLSRRPMDRIIEPLSRMGALIEAREGRFAPLSIEGRSLHAIDYASPVASAQVKTCVLLAGLFCEGDTVVREPMRTRDHTEIALREFGASITIARRVTTLTGRPALTGRELTVPADLSSAAFFLVAASIVPGSHLVLRGIGLNPSRSALLDFLLSAGASIRIVNMEHVNGEPIGDLEVTGGALRGGEISGELAAALIDEIPVLAVLGAVSDQGLAVRDAKELRVKETDRIATVVANLRRMGVSADEAPDGFTVPGRQQFRGATVDSFGDHRIAMAFAVAALRAEGETVIENAEAASVSFPGFYELLESCRS